MPEPTNTPKAPAIQFSVNHKATLPKNGSATPEARRSSHFYTTQAVRKKTLGSDRLAEFTSA